MSYSFTLWAATTTSPSPSSSSSPTKQPTSNKHLAMAVEAHHLRLFPPQQHVPKRGVARGMENQTGVYGGVGFYPVPAPASAAGNLVPFCHPAAVVSVDASDSGLTFNDLSVASSSQPRKRQRASPPQRVAAPPGPPAFSFLGEDVTSAVHQQQLEVDRLVAQHAEKVRWELWERRRQLSRHVAAAVEGWVQRRIRAKEEEIEKMGKLNTALEERVKSLCVENQIWRDLAQTNEETANALRCNLEQVLAEAATTRVRPEGGAAAPGGSVADDAESCCDNIGEYTPCGDGEPAGGRRLCRGCGVGEPSVLLLPCRHLCLCAACGPAVVACPICRCDNNGSVNVNMS